MEPFSLISKKSPQPLILQGAAGVILFKFYRSSWLRCEVIQHTVDSRNFMGNTVCNVNHHFMRNLSSGSCHNIGGAYGTNDTAPLECTLAIFDTG